MKNSILTIIFILICSIAHAGIFVFHTGETITGRAKSCGAVCSSRPDALRIDEETYNSLTRFKKVVNDEVVDMSQAEIDAILQAEADATELSIIEAIEKFEVTNLELLTALIQRINIRLPSNPITKAEVIQQLKDNR